MPIYANSGKYVLLLLLLSSLTFSASAQSFTWTDNFTQGQAPTTAQCNNWTNFLGQLGQLGQASFISVTISGTFDATGIKITDPAAATQLASLLNSGTVGTVVSGGHTWMVNNCGPGSCVPIGVELVVDGAGCNCADKYSVRPYSQNSNWGGINTASCSGVSQTMKLEFNTGVAITASGSTSFCEGGSVILTASSEKCAPPYAYLWSNGETTESITVTQPGNYSVTVSGADGCSGISSATSVTVGLTTVNAGEDVTVCSNPIQLNAVGNENGAPALPLVTKLCLFDAPNGKGNCTFTDDLCTDGYKVINTPQSFSQPATITNPIELRFLLYYSPVTDVTNFTFKLNGNIIGSFIERNNTGTCFPSAAGQYPRTITFAKTQFKQFWSDAGSNELTVEISTANGDVYVAGISSEVVSQNEFYSWSPATGLSDASIQNPVANPDVSTTYTVTYTSVDGCSATDQIQVNVSCNTPPTAVCKPVSISVDNNCEGNADAVEFDNGSSSGDGGELKYTVSPAGPYAIGETKVTLTVTDSKGESSSCSTTITVTDTELPTISTLQDLLLTNDPGSCTATLTLTVPVTADNCQVERVSNDKTDNIFPEGETIVTWTVTDTHGNSNSTTQKVIVTNEDPVINSVIASNSVVAVNTSLSLTASYTDNNVVSATIDWDDLSGLQTVTNPGNIFNVSHTYNSSGLYSVTVTLTDACGATALYVYEYIVVYDPKGGFVTGGGWFISPLGAYIQNPGTTGKASFNFVSKYKKRGTVPEGETEFRFKAGDLEFESEDYEWLVVDGNTAIFKGFGEVNGHSGYGILISVVDDNKDDDDDNDDNKKPSKPSKKSDRIRVKIWDASGSVVYDTQLGSSEDAEAATKLGGGSIQIHDDKSKNSFDTFENTIAQNAWEASTAVYPNPFTESITVQFYSSSKENLNLQLLDITGKIIYDRNHPFSEDGSYSLQFPDDERGSGLYILKINQGRRVEFLRLVRK